MRTDKMVSPPGIDLNIGKGNTDETYQRLPVPRTSCFLLDVIELILQGVNRDRLRVAVHVQAT
jgi:hypothetical protein